MRRIPRRRAAGLLLAAAGLLAGCSHTAAPGPVPGAPPALAGDALLPSPRLIVGRIIAIDTARRFAFVELAPDAPAAALGEGTELIARTAGLEVTGHLRASRQVRGRTLGTSILAGQPSPNDEVVWLAPW